MIYAVANRDERELIIAGANSLAAQQTFIGSITAIAPELVQDTDFTRFIVDRDLSRFTKTPTILEFSTTDDLDEFVSTYEIELVSMDNAISRQKLMIESEVFFDDSGRTIGEITGLNEYDPFDLRTDEEKAEDERKWEEAKKKRKAGELTGDSFTGGMGGGAPEKLTKQLVGEPGTYYRVTVNQTLGNSATDITKSYQTDIARERIKVPFEPVYSNDLRDRADDLVGAEFFFKDAAVAEVIAHDLRDMFIHVATVEVEPVDECGNVVNDEDGLMIRDIKISIDPETGEVIIERVLADKDLFSSDYYKVVLRDSDGVPLVGKEAYEPLLKRAGLADTNRYFGADYRVDPEGGILIKLGGASLQRMKQALADHDHTMVYISGKDEDAVENPLKIADDDMIDVYFRVEATDEAQAVLDLLAENNLPKPYRSANFTTGGSWFAYVRRASAEDVVDFLHREGVAAILTEVDRHGERILEEGIEGVSVIDTGAENVEPDFPWNAGRDRFAALAPKEQRRAMAGRWFLYTLRKYPIQGLIAHITPKSYFNETGKMWDQEVDLSHLLGDVFEKFGDKPGVYRCKGLELNTADFHLGNRAGMKESLALRMHVNILGEDAL